MYFSLLTRLEKLYSSFTKKEDCVSLGSKKYPPSASSDQGREDPTKSFGYSAGIHSVRI